MKYTRYNLKPKRKNSNNFLFYLAIILLLALLLGTGIHSIAKKSGTLWYKNEINNEVKEKEEVEKNTPTEKNEDKQPEQVKDDEGESPIVGDGSCEFYILQCGAFKMKENADKIISKMSSVGTPFIISEGELTKVYFGIFSKEKLNDGIAALESVGVESSKVSIKIGAKDISTVQMCESIDGLLQIVNKTCEPGVQSVKTDELKAWVGGLEEIGESMESYENAKTLKEYINSLPQEVDKNLGKDILVNIYNILIKYKTK